MIRQNNPSSIPQADPTETTPPKTYFSFNRTTTGELRISLGIPLEFKVIQTVEVSSEDPSKIWQLIHELTGIPLPVAPKTPEITVKTPLGVQTEELADILDRLSSKEIVEKVLRETGTQITISLKSKRAILRKALEVYGAGPR